MKKLTIFLIFCVISFSVLAEGLEPIPALSGRVTDITATLSPEEIIFIEQILVGLDSSTTCELVVLIIPTTGSETIEEYSMRVAEEWKIGKKEQDNGVILLIAKEDREVRIEVGYGLEAILTDLSSMRVIDSYIVPDFKNGDFYGGIYSGVGQISGIVKGEINYEFDYLKEVNVEYEVEVEEEGHKSLMSRYPGTGFLLMMFCFLIPILPLFFLDKSKTTVIITSIIPVIYVILVAFFWGGLFMIIPLMITPLFISVFSVVLKLTHKGKGKINFFSGGGSSNYSSSNSSYGSSFNSSSYGSSNSSYSSGSSYSGGGGSFGGGGASGSW